LLAAILLSGCASSGQTTEGLVKLRAQERWDYLLAEDYTAAYGYLTPGYRSGVSLNRYQRKLLTQRVQWTDAEIGQSDCLEDACKIRISIGYAVYGAVPGVSRFDSRSAVTEDWIRVDGQWYFFPPD
jgi:hypothetical protein